ncbi:hypothetical protein Cgig2_010421 [Carnegiea gigantea]|uniref:DUF4283 domain-containing protein n=1 Tax=Carnegiea gigantea TaxID=171969 RepID=A0A9Q1JHR8_9CARY|nr:hypothetical protein Cgig2_010421 [Carnegiea gigantea]
MSDLRHQPHHKKQIKNWIIEGFIKHVLAAYDIDKVIKAIYFFDNKPFLMKGQNREMDLCTESIKSLPMWVQFSDLDIKYWALNSLSKIRSIIGISIKIDRYAKDKSMIRYTRLRFEVSLEGPFLEFIEFFNDNDVLVKSEWLPIKCTHCQMFRHTKDVRKKKRVASKEWRRWPNLDIQNDFAPFIRKPQLSSHSKSHPIPSYKLFPSSEIARRDLIITQQELQYDPRNDIFILKEREKDTMLFSRPECKVEWIKYGDDSTRLFFTKAKQSKLASYIYTIEDADSCFGVTRKSTDSKKAHYIDVINKGPVLSIDQSLLEKILANVQIWSTRSISFTRRAMLISSVIFGMFNYRASIFILPNNVYPQAHDCSWNWRKICYVKELFKKGCTNPLTWEWQGDSHYEVNKGYQWQMGNNVKVAWAKLIWGRSLIPRHVFIS